MKKKRKTEKIVVILNGKWGGENCGSIFFSSFKLFA